MMMSSVGDKIPPRIILQKPLYTSPSVRHESGNDRIAFSSTVTVSSAGTPLHWSRWAATISDNVCDRITYYPRALYSTVLTAGKAKNDMPIMAQEAATNFPIHVTGTASP